MTDHYTHFCVVIRDLTAQEAEWIKQWLAAKHTDPDELDFQHMFMPVLPQEPDQVWLYSDGHSTPGQAADFCHEFLQTWRPDGILAFEYANTSSHNIDQGGFGGGAFVVTAQTVHQLGTNEWMWARINELTQATQTPSAETKN